MKSLTTYITEKMIHNKATASKYNYHPKTKEELKDLMEQLIKERGNEGDFNDIDTSKIVDMSKLFIYKGKFNGNISEWNVSNVTDMEGTFNGCNSFNQDISKWNVSKVKKMFRIFEECPIEEKYKPKFK